MGSTCCTHHQIANKSFQPITLTLQSPDNYDDYAVKIQARIGHLVRKHLATSQTKDFISEKLLTSAPISDEKLQEFQSVLEWPAYSHYQQLRLQDEPQFHPDSQIIYHLKNDQYYQGKLDKGSKTGNGRLYDIEYLYEGQFEDDLKHGLGRQIYRDGTMYQGSFIKDTIQGKGALNLHDYYYKGEFLDGKQNGFGHEETTEFTYDGSFKLGVKEGYGELVFKTGNKYLGQFSKNQYHGNGTFEYSDGRRYEGNWVYGVMQGKGIFTWPDGREYSGDYKNNLKDGQGTFKYSNGSIYKGQWMNNKPHGKGKMIQDYGAQKEGEWIDGRRIKWI
ncbi:hypothetical protein pb186bvf_008276 [Paramecium bursaria]